MKKRFDNTKQLSRRFGKKQIKQQLIDSLGFNKKIDKEDLNMLADKVNDCQEVLNIIKECEDIIKTNRKNIICFSYQQGKFFKKFKENRKFKNLAEQFKITKGTTIFKKNIVKLINKYLKMMASSITLNFSKSYYKDIKNICKESHKFFR